MSNSDGLSPYWSDLKSLISGTKIVISRSTSSSVRINGGSNRITESAVTLINKPFSIAAANKDLQGWFSSMPIMHPIPRISTTCVADVRPFSSPAIILVPIADALLNNPSVSNVLIVASAAAQASGFPPKVEP